MAPGNRAELPHNPIRQYKPPLEERLTSLYDEPPAPPTRRQKIDATHAALNRERSRAEQEAAARERSAAAEEARLERALEHERRRTLAAKLALARSQRDLAARWAARLVLRHRAGDRRLGAWAAWRCEAARRAAIARALRRAGAITVKAAKRDAWAAWRRRATQRRALAHLARRLATRTARCTFNRWRRASAVADVLRAAALAATSVTESTARRHAEAIAELEAKLAAQVAKATFDAAQVADEEAALRAAEAQEWARRVAAADAAATSERKRAAERAEEAEAGRAEDMRLREAADERARALRRT